MPERTFEFDYRPGKVTCGVDAVGEIGPELAELGYEDAMVVCGSTVGSTPEVMDPIRDALGDRLAAVFDETTPEKYLGTAVEGVHRLREADADALVAVGGGSSLDVAKVIAGLASHDRPPEAVAREAIETGSVPVSDAGEPTPIVAVPTTLAGADLSVIAGVTLALDPDEESPPSGGIGDERLMPEALFYDVDLYRTTPESILTASAMNGFDKGIDALYTRHATPITDGTAIRGLRLLSGSLGVLTADPMDEERLYEVLSGIVLVQYGISTPGAYKLSLIHAFGHGFSHDYDVHQGTAHAVVAPHVLRYVFEHVDGRRDLFAEAFDLDAGDDRLPEAIVEAVAGVRDDLGLPSRLREIEGLEREELPRIAEVIAEDSLIETAPPGLDPTVADIESVLREAW